MMYRIGILATAVAIVGSGAAHAELVVNGSLDGTPAFGIWPTPWFTPVVIDAIPGSTVPPGGLSDGGNVAAPNMPASPDGGTFALLTANAIFEYTRMRQSIAGLTPGHGYILSFYYAAGGATFDRGGPVVLPGSIQASIAGQSFQTDELAFEGPGNQTWHFASFNFIADGTTADLDIWTNDGDFYGAVDGVSIVPEPNGFVLMATALAGWAAARRRRKTS